MLERGQQGKSMRERLIQLPEKRILLARITDSTEAKDAFTEINCNGYGRVRKYQRFLLHLARPGVSRKPLWRGHPPVNELRTQVFQLAGCNWRCWYCYVDDELLSGDIGRGQYLSAEEMIDLYLREQNRPDVIELSGGQPDLVPEWGLWMMEALERRGLRNKVYIWAEDNLGTNYTGKYLTPSQIEYMCKYEKYSRLGCFKGYDDNSFCFNTGAHANIFMEQFATFAELLSHGFDMYASVTFTAIPERDSVMRAKVSQFVDRLQSIHRLLPLRTIPLKIKPFNSTKKRMSDDHKASVEYQYEVYAAWEEELTARYGQEMVHRPYEDIRLD